MSSSSKAVSDLVIALKGVLQALTNFKKVETSTLVGLITQVADIYDHLDIDASHATKRLSLKILESICIDEMEATSHVSVEKLSSKFLESICSDEVEATNKNITKSGGEESKTGFFFSHDFDFDERLETSVCINCKKGGELIVCDAYACMVKAHKSCVQTGLENEGYICSFCTYARAICEFLVRKQAHVGRKKVKPFIKIEANDDGDKGVQKMEAPNSEDDDKRKRLRKRKLQRTSPSIPKRRRKKLLWTEPEVEILMEDLKLFGCVEERFPWTVVLAYGQGVFHKDRTTIDLKDKWRNICKYRYF